MKENEKYMKEAFLQAKKAYELDEVPVGAVVVFNKKIIDIKVIGFFNLSKYILENLRELEFSFSLT